MKKRRSRKEWEAVFDLRKNFNGTTAEFCRHYGIPNSSYYSHYKAFLNEEQINGLKIKAPSHLKKRTFIQVTQPSKSQPVLNTTLLFNTHTGELSLPASLGTEIITTLIKGLLIS